MFRGHSRARFYETRLMNDRTAVDSNYQTNDNLRLNGELITKTRNLAFIFHCNAVTNRE